MASKKTPLNELQLHSWQRAFIAYQQLKQKNEEQFSAEIRIIARNAGIPDSIDASAGPDPETGAIVLSWEQPDIAPAPAPEQPPQA